MALRPAPRDPNGLVVLITGAAQGIGRETAQRLAIAGARVVIGDKDIDQVERTGHALGVMALPLDVTSAESWRTFGDEAGVLGPPDVLINNAGVMPVGPILDEPESVARAIFDVNVHGTITGVKTVVPGMVERGHGHVINIASAVGRIPSAGGATYSASKHAVVGFTDAIRQELQPLGVDVSMVLPSITRTQLALGVPDAGNVPSQTPQQVAEVIEDVVRKPVPEAWAPRWSQPLARTTGLLPRKVQAMMMAAAQANVLANVDSAARSDYEARVRGN